MKKVRRFIPYAAAFALFASVATPAAFASANNTDGAKQLETKQKVWKSAPISKEKAKYAKDAVAIKKQGDKFLITKAEADALKGAKFSKVAPRIGKAQAKTWLATKGQKDVPANATVAKRIGKAQAKTWLATKRQKDVPANATVAPRIGK
ncbi:hypothetical protein SAMN05444487_1289 [Marininema mesophilum]|uniref:Uncharacterized protein n=1 Tax=Marininema mesophilum TaxID=1048340 RepID=A0A1H3CX04_9BACL|nr:hypothetical protein [Marininema mesophilum]SDX57979.1 hypothetical protein SAMN05444487_1289 [Marininema mesophilum]